MTESFASDLGKKVIFQVNALGGATKLMWSAVREMFKPPYYFQLLLEQIYQIGVRSITLIFVTSASTGMVMVLQFGLGLEKFGGKLYVPKIVSLCIIRELGPVFSSLMLAARVGAGIASEIGSMKVTQQLDAIRALGTSPIKKIVIPRILACLISLPILCIICNTVGVLGGLVVGATELGLDPRFYLNKVFYTITITDYMSGLGKSFFFALFIAISACFYGMTVTEGTRGVGTATTRAVVTSSILIVVSDFFLTKIFWILGSWTQ